MSEMDLHDGTRADVEGATTTTVTDAAPAIGGELDLEVPVDDAVEQRTDLDKSGDDPLPTAPPGSPIEVEPADLQEQAQSAGADEDEYR